MAYEHPPDNLAPTSNVNYSEDSQVKSYLSTPKAAKPAVQYVKEEKIFTEGLPYAGDLRRVMMFVAKIQCGVVDTLLLVLNQRNSIGLSPGSPKLRFEWVVRLSGRSMYAWPGRCIRTCERQTPALAFDLAPYLLMTGKCGCGSPSCMGSISTVMMAPTVASPVWLLKNRG